LREAKSPFIFVSERGAPFTVSGLQKLVERMLRHATGFVLANKGTDTRTLQAYLGHRSIQSTVRASELCELQWTDVEFETATLHIRRAKGGTTATHPLLGGAGAP
jgi:integrase